ncbi:MAG: hypothetical protein H6Q78_1016 [Candidatus Krumholzibacteriota bacterium]|nr:hypothetical protein [Candidatus Krumholzibacteriota bacterium]
MLRGRPGEFGDHLDVGGVFYRDLIERNRFNVGNRESVLGGVSDDIERRKELWDVPLGLARQIETPEILRLVTGDGARHTILPAVVRGKREKPVVPNAVEVLEIIRGRIRGRDDVPPLVVPPVHTKPVEPRRPGDELPGADRLGVRSCLEVEPALDERDADHVLVNLLLGEDSLDGGPVELHAIEGALESLAPGSREVTDPEIDPVVHHGGEGTALGAGERSDGGRGVRFRPRSRREGQAVFLGEIRVPQSGRVERIQFGESLDQLDEFGLLQDEGMSDRQVLDARADRVSHRDELVDLAERV